MVSPDNSVPAGKAIGDIFDFAHFLSGGASSNSNGVMPDAVNAASAAMDALDGSSVRFTNNSDIDIFYRDYTGGMYGPMADQAHHFAAYFWLGAWARGRVVPLWPSFPVEAFVADFTVLPPQSDTPISNPGDFLLSMLAAQMGTAYVENPRYIGSEISRRLREGPETLSSQLVGMRTMIAIAKAQAWRYYMQAPPNLRSSP